MFILFLFIFFAASSVEAVEVLGVSSVHEKMDTIFKGHLTHKKMTPEIMSQSIKQFINQFDPAHVYLLSSETAPFLSMTKNQLQMAVDQYQKEDYSIFAKMTKVFQQAAKRMRKFRAGLKIDNELFYNLSLLPMEDLKEAFCMNEAQLQKRHSIYMAHLAASEEKRLKATKRSSSILEAIRIVELKMREFENSYLYLDNQSRALPPKEAEELFSLHILKALTASLDAHSSFFNLREAKNLRRNLEKNYEGIGLDIDEQGKAFVVVDIVPGSSAETNGLIKIGDELLAIDDQSVTSLSLSQVLHLFEGKNGTTVALDLRRRGDDLAHSRNFRAVLMRQHIVLEEGRVDTSFETTEKGIIGIVSLHAFYQGEGMVNSEHDLQQALETLSKKGKIRGLVLDLRDNRGGFLIQAVKVVGLFIKTGVVVVAKYGDGSLHYFRDVDPKVSYEGPLVVLISRQTASAAEIVTEALQDYGVAIVVGDDHSYGKASIQAQTATSVKEDEASFKVTVGQYFGVSGKSPQIEGVKSDVLIPSGIISKVGEEYLSGTISRESIAPSFKDSLMDIAPGEKGWYQQHYLPFLQQKTEKYRKWIPRLQERSQERLKTRSLPEGLDSEQTRKLLSNMQLQEAVAIAKDLANLSD